MMFKQGTFSILLILFSIIFVICSSSPVVERERRGAGAGNCNGGRNVYQTFCYGDSNGNRQREADVQACFNKLQGLNLGFGCRTETQGGCRCTVDSSFIWNWEQTFKEAREKLYQGCHGFTNNIMERYEGNMYLTATC